MGCQIIAFLLRNDTVIGFMYAQQPVINKSVGIVVANARIRCAMMLLSYL